jgi:broad specificity phosphatase PhoE
MVNSMEIKNQTTIYFIRHGQTPSNAKGVQQGDKIDDYLNTAGVMQIQELAKIASFLNLDILFTSYLHRAEETASIIEDRLIQPVQLLHDFRLRERNFGSLSGKTEKEWDLLLPNHQELENLQMYDYRPFGGENVEDVRQRAVSAILDISQNYDHKSIGVVTHAGVIRLMQFHFPDIIRIYHAQGKIENAIGNSDVYEWQVTDDKIANLKSLLKRV